MKGDLRQEIAVQGEIAALKGQVGHQQAAAPTVINISHDSHDRGGGGRVVPLVTERYCGPISWIVGIFLFPCICFCPIDQRTRPAAMVID